MRRDLGEEKVPQALRQIAFLRLEHAHFDLGQHRLVAEGQLARRFQIHIAGEGDARAQRGAGRPAVSIADEVRIGGPEEEVHLAAIEDA